MHVLTIGGAGQLGHFVLKHLASEGHQLSVIGMGAPPEEGYLPKGTHFIDCDVEKATEKELEKHFKDHDEKIEAIFEAIRQLMIPPKKSRKPIGFEVKETAVAYYKQKKQKGKIKADNLSDYR